MTTGRPTLAFGKESVEKYREVNKKLFKDQLTNKDLFLIATAFGFHFASRAQKFERAATGARTELTDGDLYLLQALAFEESGQAESLPHDQERNEVAMQFAEGGIQLIYDLVKDKTEEHARTAFLREFQKTLKS